MTADVLFWILVRIVQYYTTFLVHADDRDIQSSTC